MVYFCYLKQKEFEGDTGDSDEHFVDDFTYSYLGFFIKNGVGYPLLVEYSSLLK